MKKTRVILISSVRPEATSAGQIILHRHLVDQPRIDLQIYGSEPKKLSPSTLLRRILGRVSHWGVGFRTVVNCLWVLWMGRWLDVDLPVHVPQSGNTVVVTVAHGEGFYSAHRFAKKHQLPLVVFFHDWWPDMVELPKLFRRILEKHFLSLAKNCSLGLCVSEGMREALGAGMNLNVLPPIPATQKLVEIPQQLKSSFPTFRILYFGNLEDYGPMLGEALEESLKYPEILLQMCGANPKWDSELCKTMRANGRWLDFAPRNELENWLASADAFLIPMVFDPAMSRRMKTSFPSKLTEFAQFGKPLIIWGPEYCSAIRWGKIGNKAICVTDADPRVLIKSIIALKTLLSEQSRLSRASIETAKGEFHPEKIQDNFLKMMSAA